jgi:hypothetical protein
MAFPPGKNPGKPFKPGVSGNPGGKPKVIIEVVQAARERTVEAIKTLTKIMLDPKATGSARVSAAVAILERGWGKPAATISLNHEGDLRTFSDAELTAIIASESAEDGAGANGSHDPTATPDHSSKRH